MFKYDDEKLRKIIYLVEDRDNYFLDDDDNIYSNNENGLMEYMKEKENEIYELPTPISEKKTIDDDELEVNLPKFCVLINNDKIISNELISPKNTSQHMEIEESKSNLLSNSNPITQNTNDNVSPHKFSDDNLRRKCKQILLDNLLYFINYKIRMFYNGNIGKGILTKQLKKLNQKLSNSNIKFNKEFLFKSIRDIFSDKISSRITNCPPEHNKIIIQSLLNEKDINKKNYFNNLFSLTFFQCLEHFRGTNSYPELKEMNTLKNELKKYSNIDYVSNLDYYFHNYEIIINKKKSRKSRKQKELDN